jgi:hypothetical protein
MLCVVLSGPLLLVSKMLWSEPLFILLTVLFLWRIHACLRSPTLGRLILAGVLAALAAVTRYIGVTVVMTGCILLLLSSRATFRRRITAYFIFGTISVIPLTVWLIRNWLIAGVLTGNRSPSDMTLLENVSLAGEQLASFFLPWRMVYAIPGTLWFVVIVVAWAAATAFVAYRQQRRGEPWQSSPAVCATVFAAVYLAFLIASAMRVAFDPLNWRLLSPLYAPAILVSFQALGEAFRAEAGSDAIPLFRPMLLHTKRFFILAVLVWICFAATGTLLRTRLASVKGAGGFNSVVWQESETVAFLRSRELPGPIYTNAPDAIYIFLGERAPRSPLRETRRGVEVPVGADLAAMEAHLMRSGEATLVWFENKKREYLCTPDQLAPFLHLKRIARLDDGSVYELHAQAGDAATADESI